MLKVGLTGGIASGKSTVARRLRALGLPVVDADRLAREVVEVGSPVFERVVARFGPEVVGPDGRLDRAALGGIVFRDRAARAELETLTHPAIVEAIVAELGARRREGEPLAVVEAALIFEAGLGPLFDLVVVVAARPEVQVRRVVRRDRLTEAEARARVGAQMPMEDKVARADVVVWNEGELEALERRVAELHRDLLGRLGPAVDR